MRRLLAGWLLILVAACAPAPSGPSQATRQADVRAHDYAGLIAPAVGTVDKILVITGENHGYSQTVKGAPKIMAYARWYGYATKYRAITHPSQPNYVAIAFGSTMGIKDDGYKPVSGSTVFGGALKAGRTVKNYEESMGSTNCRTSNLGNYRQKHNAWTTAKDERALCRKYDVDAKALAADITAGALPNVGFLTPNICNDAHDCPLATFDQWVDAKVRQIAAGPDWKSRRLAIVVTFDEDNRKEGNRIVTAVLHPAIRQRVVTTGLNHYSLSAALADVGHTTRLRNAKTAPELWAAFGLAVQ